MSEQDSNPNVQPPAEPAETEAGPPVETVTLPVEEFEALKKAAAERDEYLDSYRRALADYQNLQTRSSRRVQEATDVGIQQVASALFPIIDNLHLAIKSSEETPDIGKLRDGLRLIEQQIDALLAKFEIRSVETLGRPFDPDVHDAMAHVPTGDHAPDTVMHEYQRGYVHKDRLLRPARVIVAKPLPKPDEDKPS